MNKYLETLALAYLMAPNASREEWHAEKALDRACARHGVRSEEVCDKVHVEHRELILSKQW